MSGKGRSESAGMCVPPRRGFWRRSRNWPRGGGGGRRAPGVLFLPLLLAWTLLVSCGTGSPEGPVDLVSVALSSPFEHVSGTFPNEPPGFRDCRWNLLLADASGMEPFRVERAEGLTWYTHRREPLRVGTQPVDRVFYGFSRRDRLVAGFVGFAEDGYPQVRAYLQRHFGEPNNAPGQGSRICSWEGRLALIKLFPDKLVVVNMPYLEWLQREGGIGRPSYLEDIY